MLAPHVEFRRLVQLDHRAVDSRPHEAAGLQLLDEFRVLALALRYGGREQHHGGPLRMLKHGVHHLAHRLRGEVDVVIGAARRAGARIQEPQVVVHLGDRTHRRARDCARSTSARWKWPATGPRWCRGPASPSSTGIGARRSTAIPRSAAVLRHRCVEGQRGLAGPGKAGQHDQPIARQVEIDILQIVGPGTPDADILHVTDYYTPGVKAAVQGPPRGRRQRPSFCDEHGAIAADRGSPAARVQYVSIHKLAGACHGARSQQSHSGRQFGR